MKKFISIVIVLAIGIGIGYYLFGDKSNTDVNTTEFDYQQQEDVSATYNEEESKLPIDDNITSSLDNLPPPEDIYADFDVYVYPDNSFLIKTNLPDETELMLTLKGRGYIAQGSAVVSEGSAVSPPFTNHGDKLIGDFELEVMMPIANGQSDYVKHFIGKHGEYLKGEYAKGAMGSVIVEKTFDVTLPVSED